MSDQDHNIYEFGPFRLDARKRLLMRGDEIVPLKPKAFDTLLALVEGGGRVLEKDELMKRVWPDTVVEEGNLTFNISSLRKALGERPNQHEYIVTIPGEGYRFVAGVRAAFDEVEVRERTRLTIEQGEEASNGDVSRPSTLTFNPSAVVTTQALPKVLAKPQLGTQQSIVNRRVLTISAVAALLVMAGAAFLWLRANKTQTVLVPEQNRPRDPMTIVRLSDLGSVSAASISPDGKFVAYAQNYDRGTGSLYVRQVDTNAESQLLAPGERIFGTTAFSPDGAFIYYIAYDQRDPGGALHRIPVLGGHPTRLLPGVKLKFTLSPDGRHATFFRDEPEHKQTSLVVAALDGSGERKVLTRRRDEMLFENCPAWSPGGSMIVFGAVESPETVDKNLPNVRLYTINVGGGEVRKLSDERWRSIGKMNWMPDGSGLLFIGDRRRIGQQIYFLPFPAGEAQRITTDVNTYGNYGLGVTTDGKTLVADFLETFAHVWSVDANGSIVGAEQLTAGSYDGARSLTTLPDGSIVHVALTRNTWDLWMISGEGGRLERTPLTSDDFIEREVSAAPDGSFLIFTSDRAGNQHLFKMDPDGSEVRQLTFGDNFESAPDVSPDGRWIAYNSQSKLWKISSAGGGAVQLTDYECVAPAFSPDGKYIACILPVENQVNNATLAALSSDGGQPVRTFAVVPFAWNYKAARWTPDGQALVFHKTEKQVGNLWKQNLAGGAPKPLTNFKSELIFNLIFSRDGKRIILSRGKYTVTTVMLKHFR